jgi:threonine synthase
MLNINTYNEDEVMITLDKDNYELLRRALFALQDKEENHIKEMRDFNKTTGSECYNNEDKLESLELLFDAKDALSELVSAVVSAGLHKNNKYDMLNS